ncbi:MAG: uracil-DNA glycosylase family protein [Myxococcales bacterium]|nr:uracil-DNA glycosylase family protein [Myxococcales bacterium]
MTHLDDLLAQARACTLCPLPHGHRPVLRLGRGARVVVIGQAPGAKVHASGVPWDDASGAHLRTWLALDEAVFADPEQVAILPMGLCWPGRRSGGDLPPRPECAPRWHPPLLAALADPRLVLLVGSYAIARYLGAKATLTDTVRAFASAPAPYFPLPHPSWRSRLWMQQHPWFEAEVLPALRARVAAALQPS